MESKFFMTSLIARISLVDSFKFKQTSVKKINEKIDEKEILKFEPVCRFQPNSTPTKASRNYTFENFRSMA